MPATSIVYDATPAQTRNRLTVFFRMILVIPHILTLLVYGIGLFFAVVIAWFALLFTGRWPAGLYAFVGNANRYSARLNAYMYLLVDVYPPFDLAEHAEYPVQLHVAAPLASYSRVKVFFRGLLFIPVYIIVYVLGIVAYAMAILIWLLGVIVGKTPDGLANIQEFCLSYTSRAYAYATLLTEDWPQISQDAAVPPAAAPAGFAPPASGSSAPPPPPPPPAANPFGA